MMMEWLKLRVMVIVDIVLAGISFVDAFDVTVRIVSALSALGLAIYGMIHYHSKIKLNRLESQIKEQELYDIIESNKKKHKRK